MPFGTCALVVYVFDSEMSRVSSRRSRISESESRTLYHPAMHYLSVAALYLATCED